MFQNKNLLVIAVIAVVNALGYGIIIPILYSYSLKYGLNDFQNGLLFATFSLFQFIATPVIGRMSDKYGRKPLLLASISGTAISFLMMAWAPSAIWLFLARALDGITAGNIPVASAVISDTTQPADRAKGFGIIGASFGFGFIFGPAISAFTLPYGANIPFFVAAVVSVIALFMTWIILPETNQHLGEMKQSKLFDPGHLIKAIFDPDVGLTLVIVLFYSLAFGLFIYAFQPVATKILLLTERHIAFIFTLAGVMGLIAQAGVIPRFTRHFGEKKALNGSLFILTLTFTSFFLVRDIKVFMAIVVVNALANAFVMPLTQALLSKEVDSKSQGTILGLVASYQSIGMIVGPIVGGLVATYYIPLPFLVGAGLFLLSLLVSIKIHKKPHPLQHTF